MKLPSTFTDSAYRDAARAYGQGNISHQAWEKLARRPLFQIWLRGVLRYHFDDAGEVCARADRNQP